WPGAVVINLETNYRSASAIVSAAQSLIRYNKDRFDFVPAAKRHGGSVRLVECADEAGISSCVIKEIESRMGGLTSLTAVAGGGGARFSDFAVLYRTRSSARALVEAFRSSSLPYYLVTPQGPEIEDFLEHLQGQSPEAGLTLAAFIAREADAAVLGEGMRELLLWLAAKYGEEEASSRLCAFVEEAGVLAETGVPEIKSDRVNLMTLHAAKGLEFKTVFIVGVEEGLIPLGREGTSLEEERRLFYVGLTRASDEVVLLAARKRRLYAAAEDRSPSPFINELGEGVLKTSGPAPKKYVRRAVQKGLFE
ncbi:MAG: 3'-5' exonuclease, partial [Thermodesulfobacteriota bacterium]